VFAPAAAHLCNGVDLAELGELIEPATLLPGLLPVTREEKGAIVAEVLWVDRFGNAQLNVDPQEIESFGDRLRLRFAESKRTAVRAENYAALRTGEVGLVVDSYGLLSVAVDRGSAADTLGLHAGDPVTLEAFEGPLLTLRAVDASDDDRATDEATDR
jgi:hypothetical protein